MNNIDELSKQPQTEEWIRTDKHHVNWNYISAYQKLSESFIREFNDKVNWNYISKYQKLSESFITEFELTIPDTCWLYKDFDYKKNYIISNTDYELDGDYLIAYKACRSDGYSKYNFQFKYELNKEYECHANYNIDEENSFGLSSWTYDKTKEYCNELIFKVKIHINDIACFIHDNNKIRCSKLKTVEIVK